MDSDLKIAELNEIGKKCWLIVSMHKSVIDPFRDQRGRPLSIWPPGFKASPMNRRMLMVDGFTQIDFEELQDGQLRILSNACCDRDLPEDEAFDGEEWQPGKLVTWDQLVAGLKRYCQIANQRIGVESFERQE